nr:unnamed protein product [Digitaria exilis]
MLCLWYITLALIYGSLLFMIFSELLGCFRQWRSRRDAELAADRLLESVPDVSYQQLPGQECCVVCMEEYEHGERCFVMPGCAHMFHRGCIAPWVRQGNTTCPLCRASLAAVPPAQHSCITTPEDMV